MHVAHTIVGVLVLMLLTGCTKKQEPEKESKIGLEQAMKGVEQAEEGFKGMREKGEALQRKIDEQTKLLDATLAKHIGFLVGRADAGNRLISGLSLPNQATLLPLLADIRQQISGAEANFREYRDAAPGKTEESKAKLETALEQLNAAFARFDARVREAEVK